MDLSKMMNKITTTLGKFKYVILILCIGLVLLLIPTGNTTKQQLPLNSNAEEEHISQTDLIAILSKIEGAGRVEVLLSLECTQRKDYQSDHNGSTAEQNTTVTVTDAQRNETGLITKVHSPVYRGAIVVCDGADDPATHLSIVDAVSNITGLRSDQISVLKMK